MQWAGFHAATPCTGHLFGSALIVSRMTGYVPLSCSTLLTEKNRQITKGTYYVPLISRAIKLNNALDYEDSVLLKSCRGAGRIS